MKSFIYPSSIETARALVLHLVEMMMNEPEKSFNIALSGGTTPALMYDLWANEYREVTPWKRLRIFFVDERCVPAENSESNYGMVRSLLLSMVPIPYDNVFYIRGDEPPAKEALRYGELLEQELPQQNGWPIFDVILLGVGVDGHTASLFSGQEKLLVSSYSYEATFHPCNGQKRITLTGLPMQAARKVIFLITGKSKMEVVEEMYNADNTGPAAYIAHHVPNVELFMDEAAAERVR